MSAKSDRIMELEKKKAYFTSRLNNVSRPQAKVVLSQAIEDVKQELRKLGVKQNEQ